MAKKYFLFFILFLILLCSFCYSAPALKDIVILSGGLSISYPHPEYIKVNDPLYLRWWVFNSTNGELLTNSTINCTYNLLDYQGKNILRYSSTNVSEIKFGNLGSNACQNCFNMNISNNFNRIGQHEYQLRCAGNKVGGVEIGGYEVTADGFPVNSDKAGKINNMIITLAMLIAMYFIVGILNKGLRIKIFSLGFGIIECIVLYSITHAELINIDVTSLFIANFYINLILGFAIGMVGIVLYTIDMVNLNTSQKEEEAKWNDENKWL